jgi:predicted nucleic acid-binding protein
VKVVVDTSVWSLSLRKDKPSNHVVVKKLAMLLEENMDVFIIGVILQEVLQAFRHEKTFQKLVKEFDSLPLLAVKKEDYVSAAKLRRKCAGKGISASTIDCLIASMTVSSGSHLLTADKDFSYIASVSGLRLL